MSGNKDTLFGRLAVARGRLTQKRPDETCEAQERGAGYTLVEKPGKDRISAPSAAS